MSVDSTMAIIIFLIAVRSAFSIVPKISCDFFLSSVNAQAQWWFSSTDCQGSTSEEGGVRGKGGAWTPERP